MISAADRAAVSPLPLADHGDILSALPFVLPAILIVCGILFLVVRDRLGERNGSADGRR